MRLESEECCTNLSKSQMLNVMNRSPFNIGLLYNALVEALEIKSNVHIHVDQQIIDRLDLIIKQHRFALVDAS